MSRNRNPIVPRDKKGKPLKQKAVEISEEQLNSAPEGAEDMPEEEGSEENNTEENSPEETGQPSVTENIVTDDKPESSKGNTEKDTKKPRKPRKNQGGGDIATD